MDHDTLSEMVYAVITTIVAVMLITTFTSTSFINKSRELVDKSIPQQEQQSYQNDEAFEEYINNSNK